MIFLVFFRATFAPRPTLYHHGCLSVSITSLISGCCFSGNSYSCIHTGIYKQDYEFSLPPWMVPSNKTRILVINLSFAKVRTTTHCSDTSQCRIGSSFLHWINKAYFVEIVMLILSFLLIVLKTRIYICSYIPVVVRTSSRLVYETHGPSSVLQRVCPVDSVNSRSVCHQQHRDYK